jgi:TRAP-type transport system small permease protein
VRSVDAVLRTYCRLLEGLIALALLAMVVMVFGNVVLRYAFNSGITVSEELSRWAFVWLTFLGAVVGLHERAHLGTDVLVSRLGPQARRLCLVVGQVVMLGITIAIFRGSWVQTSINLDVEAPVSGFSMGWVYGAGCVFAASAVPILVLDLWRTIAGPTREPGGEQ